MEIIEIISLYFLYFIIYAFIGWCLEVSCKLVELKRFVNRGFLVGPLCPIYGYGVLLIVILIGKPTNDYLAVFLKSILVCSVLEYLTSYVMEKLFKARWWDYSRRKFNLNGRICLNTMIPFGLLGCLVVYILHPTVEKLVGILSIKTRLIIALIIFIIYVVDNIFSFIVVKKIKNVVKKNEADNTEAIKDSINDWFENNSILYKRIIHAYPTFMIAVSNVKNTVKSSVNRTKEEFTKEYEYINNSVNKSYDYFENEFNSNRTKARVLLVRLTDTTKDSYKKAKDKVKNKVSKKKVN